MGEDVNGHEKNKGCGIDTGGFLGERYEQQHRGHRCDFQKVPHRSRFYFFGQDFLGAPPDQTAQRPGSEAVNAADDAEIHRGHEFPVEHQKPQGQGNQAQYSPEGAVFEEEDRCREDEVGPELRADAPARAVEGEAFAEAEGVEHKQVGDDIIRGGAGAGQRRGLAELGQRGNENLHQLDRDKGQKRKEVQRIESPEAQAHEGCEAVALLQTVEIIDEDDKAAEDEKKIDIEARVEKEGDVVEVVIGVKMKERHHAGADAAPTVQNGETVRGLGGHLRFLKVVVCELRRPARAANAGLR